jgi:hypothetical protein
VLLSVVDGLLAALLIMLSGFTFGYHEGLHGDSSAVAIWSFGLAACIAAPVGGFVLRAYRKPGLGVFIAGLPVIVALFLAFVA